MKINHTQQVKDEIDKAAYERAMSDEENYLLSSLIRKRGAVVDFADCTSFHEAPFDRCLDDTSKRRMFASIMAMGTARKLTHFSAPAVAANIDLVLNYYQNMKEFTRADEEEDPYMKEISLPLSNCGRLHFSHAQFRKGELFLYGEPKENGYGDLPRLGYFSEDINVPMLTLEDKGYVILNPNFFLTQQKHLPVASGHVLVLGGEAGYFLYMAQRKDSVSKVTLVENNPDTLAFIRTCVLPICSDKVEIIEADPLYFLEDHHEAWNMIYGNCWRNSVEGTGMYLHLKQFEKQFRKTKFSYWLEDSILANIKSSILVDLMAETAEKKEEVLSILAEDQEGKKLHDQLSAYLTMEIISRKFVQSLFLNKELRKYFAKSPANP